MVLCKHMLLYLYMCLPYVEMEDVYRDRRLCLLFRVEGKFYDLYTDSGAAICCRLSLSRQRLDTMSRQLQGLLRVQTWGAVAPDLHLPPD